ncbi:unnamed protein product, partial [Allacma fusca]
KIRSCSSGMEKNTLICFYEDIAGMMPTIYTLTVIMNESRLSSVWIGFAHGLESYNKYWDSPYTRRNRRCTLGARGIANEIPKMKEDRSMLFPAGLGWFTVLTMHGWAAELMEYSTLRKSIDVKDRRAFIHKKVFDSQSDSDKSKGNRYFAWSIVLNNRHTISYKDRAVAYLLHVCLSAKQVLKSWASKIRLLASEEKPDRKSRQQRLGENLLLRKVNPGINRS